MAFVARLCDVGPGRRAVRHQRPRLQRRPQRHPARLADATREPLTPGAVYELRIELDCTAWRFEPGHRIRLAVSSADFPNLWPTPYPGTNRVYRGARHPSRLLLPVIPTRGSRGRDAPPPAPLTPAPYRLAPDEPVWQIVQDVLGDRTGLRTHTRGRRPPRPRHRGHKRGPARASGPATATRRTSSPPAPTTGVSPARTA